MYETFVPSYYIVKCFILDLRLYKENSAKKPSKRDWECVCSSLPEWQGFAKQYSGSKIPAEKELFCYITEKLMPKIETQLKVSITIQHKLTPLRTLNNIIQTIKYNY